MSARFIWIAAFVSLSASPSVAAPASKLDVNATTILLDFWTSLKSKDGREAELVAENATLGAMGLGGRYDGEIIGGLAADCELAGVLAGGARDAADSTKYVWALLECSNNGKIDRVPLGVGVQDKKITQIEIDMFSQLDLDPFPIEDQNNSEAE